VTLEALTGDLEANNLATQLADAFSQAKWNVTMTSVIVAGSPPVGIQIEVPGQAGQPVPEPFSTLMTLLKKLNLTVVAVPRPAGSDPTLLVGVVG